MSGAESAFYKPGKSYYLDCRLRGGETLVRVPHNVNIFSEILDKGRMARACVATYYLAIVFVDSSIGRV